MSSFIIRDALGPAVGTANQRLALWRRFKAAWPHNKAVYNERLVYYEDGDVLDTYEFNRFLNIVGMSRKSLEDQDYDEIESCWFYLKPPTLKSAEFTAEEMLADMETERVYKDDICIIRFRYGGNGLKRVLPGDNYETTDTLTSETEIFFQQEKAMTPAQIQTEVMAHPGAYIMSQMPRQMTDNRNTYTYVDGMEVSMTENQTTIKNDSYKKSMTKLYEKPVCQITSNTRYGWYSVFDINNVNFTIDEITEPTSLDLGQGYGLEWTVTYIATKDIVASDPCMQMFEPMFNERPDLPKANGSLPYIITEEDFRQHYEVTDPDMWPNGRLSVPNSDAMKRVDFVDMLGTCIDADYKVEDPSFWEKIVTVVIIIIAVVVTIFSCGTLTGAVWYVAAAMLSFAFAMGALVLGVGSALLGYFGGPSAQSMVKLIGGIAQFVGIIATILGIFSFIGKFFKKASSEAIKEAAKESADNAVDDASSKAAGKIASNAIIAEGTKLASESFVTRAFSVMKEGVTSSLSFSGESVAATGKKLTSWAEGSYRIYEYYDKNFGEMADLQDAATELAEDLEQYAEENASSKTEMMNTTGIYASSLGSFDAIAELNIKMDKQCGGWFADQDPCGSIT